MRVPLASIDPGLVDLELDGVEDQLGDRVDDVDRRRDGAAERAGVEVGLEHQVVAARDDGSGEAVRVGALRVGHGGCSSDLRDGEWSVVPAGRAESRRGVRDSGSGAGVPMLSGST